MISELSTDDQELFWAYWKDSSGLHIERYNGAFFLMRGNESDGRRYTEQSVITALRSALQEG